MTESLVNEYLSQATVTASWADGLQFYIVFIPGL